MRIGTASSRTRCGRWKLSWRTDRPSGQRCWVRMPSVGLGWTRVSCRQRRFLGKMTLPDREITGWKLELLGHAGSKAECGLAAEAGRAQVCFHTLQLAVVNASQLAKQ